MNIIIFGVTGELYKQKLAPALWYLFSSEMFPQNTKIIGFGRKPLGNGGLKVFTEDAVTQKKQNLNKKKLEKFLSLFEYVEGNINDVESFKKLKEKVSESKETSLFYLAVPQEITEAICRNIIKVGLHKNKAGGLARIMIEKPFGTSGAHARKLDNLLRKSFTDEQIFRIDHYLAKETMLHILPLRFSNKDLIKIWGNKYIERIRVVFAEEEKSEDKIEKRGEFYDGVGALRDVGQNHVLQMLTAIVMEKPKDKTATNIQTARAQVLQKFKISQNATLVRGQYKGYLEEPEVKKDSKTETFFRVTLELKEKKWKDVPLIIESGKALDHEEMSMEIFFKNVDSTEPSLKFVIVSSGNDAYEKVLEYAIRGEKHIFTSREEVLAEWKITENIMKKWKDSPLLVYEKGSALERI